MTRSAWGAAVAERAGSALLSVLGATLRFDVRGRESFLGFRARGEPVIFVFWHSRILPLAHVHRNEGAVVLVSHHRDGELIARILERRGYFTARGSSTRGGAAGLRELVRGARSGRDLAITPDGPKGPARRLKGGVLLAAQLTGAPLIPVAAGGTSVWRLGSWDRFVIPRPFARIRVRYGDPIVVPREAAADEVASLERALEAELNRLTDLVDGVESLVTSGAGGDRAGEPGRRDPVRTVAGPRFPRGAAARLRGWWDGEQGGGARAFAAVAAPLSIAYGLAVRARGAAYGSGLLRRSRGPIPVVSVGNLSVGGTGKTPVSGWLVAALAREGLHPALVTRGYGEDEILLHRRWNPDAPVVQAARRLDGVRTAATLGCRVAVLDDGFQHRALRRDVDIALLSPADPLPPRLLPRGPWREPLRAIRRADIVAVTIRQPDDEEAARELRAMLVRRFGIAAVHLVRLVPGPWQDLAGRPAATPDGPVLAVASVARPDGFRRLLATEGLADVDYLAFPDHHAYTERDVDEIARRAGTRGIVTTEKDAVKLEWFADRLPGARVLPLRVHADGALTKEILSRLPGRARPEHEGAE